MVVKSGMSGTAAAHVEAVEDVRMEKRVRPEDGTDFCGVRRRRSGKYGAQIWDRSRGANVWLGTFGTAEEAARAFDAAAVQLRGAAKIPAGASVTVVKAEEHGDGADALPDTQTKFENVHKYYYKRRKDSRAGRNDGKACPVSRAVAVPGMVGPSAVRALPERPSVGATAGMATPNLRFSTSNTENSDAEGTDDMGERGRRKRTSEAAGDGSEKMMRFFEGLTKQAMERQEAMQQLFLEAMEKREQDRMIREEAWRRQETARLAREQEILAQDRAVAATRHAEVLSVIQKITAGQTAPDAAAPAPSPQRPTSRQPQPSPRPQKSPTMPPATPQPQQQQALEVYQSSKDTVMTRSGCRGGAASSSPWLKTEVHALIQLRSNLDVRYQEAEPKRSKRMLWPEISAGMRRMGYNRSSKQCQKKWDNMIAYFNRMKKSDRKRPEDSMTTCPDYFHQLEALHRRKAAFYANAALQDRIRMEAFTVAVPISQRAPCPHNDGEGSSMDLLLDDFAELSFT